MNTSSYFDLFMTIHGAIAFSLGLSAKLPLSASDLKVYGHLC